MCQSHSVAFAGFIAKILLSSDNPKRRRSPGFRDGNCDGGKV